MSKSKTNEDAGSETETNETTNTPSNEENETPPEDKVPGKVDVTDWEKEAKKWKELSRKNETAAKANSEKAKRLDEIEEASKSELQKAQEENERLQAEAREAIREAVAQKHGVPANFVNGATREDMEASAKELQEWGGAGKSRTQGSGTDAAGKRGDSINTDQLTKEDLKSMSAEDIDKARLAGRLDDVLGRR